MPEHVGHFLRCKQFADISVGFAETVVGFAANSVVVELPTRAADLHFLFLLEVFKSGLYGHPSNQIFTITFLNLSNDPPHQNSILQTQPAHQTPPDDCRLYRYWTEGHLPKPSQLTTPPGVSSVSLHLLPRHMLNCHPQSHRKKKKIYSPQSELDPDIIHLRPQ